MSRSRRKTPFAGVTAAPSDKASKRESNRTLRQAQDRAVALDPESPLPTVHQALDRWSMVKEGKFRFDPKDWPKGMRK
ncbi:MAG: hypothetical protein JNN18_22680 [Rubrivivax sp.]|jgi:hypothetical protein|nr:hypothetical protein [Rubrivivax sp.]